MTYLEIKRGGSAHQHRYAVDSSTREEVCFVNKCGHVRGEERDKNLPKYKNKSSIYNGITFHSGFEASYAAELDLRIRAKDIVRWERQVKLDLKVNGHHINNYFIDFIAYYPDGSREFIEVKGMELEPWKTNWKILEATFEDFKQHPDDRLLVVKEKSRFRSNI